jgi:hypothetical protein
MRKRPVLLLVLVGVGLLVAVGIWRLHLPELARVGVGYAAQQTCACLFISGRPAASCRAELDPMAQRLVKVQIGAGEVSAGSMGLAHARARYTRGLGCTLTE